MSSPLLVPPLALAAERKADGQEQRAGVVVGLGRGRDRHVETADLLDVVVVALRKDDVLVNPERVVAAHADPGGAESGKGADAWRCDGAEPVEELVHARSS